MTDRPTTYSNEQAGSVSWLVYINGLQVPCTAVSVSCGVWQIPEASIQMVPDVSLARLGAEDRVMVQVFYCDQWHRSPAEFCLMFDGEIVAWSYVSTTGGRALSFQCVDYMAILTQIFFFFMSSFDDIAVGTSGQQIGVFANQVQLAGFGALYPYSLFSQGLADVSDGSSNTAPISRPIDFAYNIVRSLIKAQHPNRTVPAVNFFAPWVKKSNFHRRWVALPFLDSDPGGNNSVGVFPILRAVQANSAISAVARLASSTGTQGSMWDMLREVLMTMMMEVSMIPTPAAVRSDYASLLPQGPPSDSGPTFLASYFVKPQFYFGLPPSCNVFFPSQISSYTYNENYATQPTRMYFNEEAFLAALSPSSNNASGGLRTLMQDALTTAYPEECDQALRAAVSNPPTALNGKNMLVYPEEFYKGPVVDRRSMPRWFMYIVDAVRNQGEQPANQPDTGTSPDANNNSAGAINTVRYDQATLDELSGATDAVIEFHTPQQYNRYVAPLLASRGLTGSAGLQRSKRPISDAVRAALTQRVSGRPLGRATAPQVFPISPPTAVFSLANMDRSGNRRGYGGSFFAGRTPTRMHAGFDFGAPRGTLVVSPVDGTVEIIISVEAPPQGRGRIGNFAGNWVGIRDAAGGMHRLMHMDRFHPTVHARRRVRNGIRAGDPVGYVGNSAELSQEHRSMGVHLHYDVTSSGGYRLNYESRLQDMWLGRLTGTPTQTVAPAAAPPAPAAGQAANPAAPPATPEEPEVTTAPGASVPNPKPNETRGEGTVQTVTAAATEVVDAINNAASSGSGASPAGPSATEVAAGDTARDLFRLYAQYEYYKERYSRRQGGVTMPFNPYPVPGFPCMTFDRRSSAIDTLGYIMSIRWRMTAASWDTDVAFSHGRTLQEMFALMQRTYATEAARLGLQRADITNAVVSQNAEVLNGFARPLGAIAVAPAEPLQEIRDVIQHFRTANEFYLTLFHQKTSQGRMAISSEGVQDGAVAQQQVAVPYQTVEEVSTQTGAGLQGTTQSDVNTRANSTGATIDNAQLRSAERVAGTVQPADASTLTDLFPRRGVFFYPEIIDFVEPGGQRSGIQIEGVDSSARTRLLEIIQKIREGTQTEDDIEFYVDAIGERPEVRVGTGTLAQLSIAGSSKLNELEIDLRIRSASSNLRGDVEIVPRPDANALFENYGTAMRYNGRPICTLDEYVNFLGSDGLREGVIAAGAGGPQKHPAKFYVRIRRLRSGPPNLRPTTNMTNTGVVTDAPAGNAATVPTPEVTSADPSNIVSDPPAPPTTSTEAFGRLLLAELAGLENRLDNPAILQTLNRVFGDGYQLRPAEELRANLATALTAQAVSPEDFNKLQAALSRAQGGVQGTATRASEAAAEGTAPATETPAQAEAANETVAVDNAAAAGAPAPTPAAEPSPTPQGTYVVDGIPLTFAQTRADWDSALEQYRNNVLNKIAPYR